MKKYLLASAAIGLLAVGAPTAHAADPTVQGGCRISTVNDTTPGGALGGQGVFTGQVNLAAVAVNGDNTPASGTATCTLVINGVPQLPPALSVTSTGVFVGADTVQFNSNSDSDVIEICTDIPTTPPTHFCQTLTLTQVVPQPVVDAIDLVIATLNDNVLSKIDPTLCPLLGSLAPGIPPAIYIDPEGDTYVGGHTINEKVWDCPPYDPPTAG